MVRNLIEKVRASALWMRIASNSFWSVLGSFSGRALSVIATVLLARIIGRRSMGEFGIIQSTMSMFAVLGGFGLNLTATRFVAEFKYADAEKAGNCAAFVLLATTVTSFSAAMLMSLLAPYIASKLLNAPQLTQLIRIASLILIFNVAGGVQTGILVGLERFRRTFQINTLSGIVGLFAIVGGALHSGLPGALTAHCIGLGFVCGVQYMIVQNECRKMGIGVNYKTCIGERKMLWRFSVPALLSNAVIILLTWACNMLLVNQPNGYEEMGAFAVGLQWYNFMLIVPGLLGQVVLPILSERMGIADSQTTLRLWRLSVRVNLLFAAAATLLGWSMSSLIMRAYGEEFAGYELMLKVIFLCGALHAVLDAAIRLVIIRNRMWLVCIMNSGWALVCLLVSVYFVRWGALGLASARLVAYTLHAVWISVAVMSTKRDMEKTLSVQQSA